MASKPSLMTFRVRAPLDTQSVDLYGSWDNFSAPYHMQKDSWLGGEHWTACHSYDNIICNGQTDICNESRHGALGMGGTYWYYYKLNDDIEFHNSAEPSTTACPLLPGHLINKLHVPAATSHSRGRNASVSSTNSDQRMLSSEDRFMNPRPVPTPKLARLTPSPGVMQFPHSSHNSPTTSLANISRCASRDNLQVPNMHRLPRMASCDALSRSSRILQKPAGLRQAFKTLRSGRSESPEAHYKHIIDWEPIGHAQANISAPQTPEPDRDAASYFELKHPQPLLPSRQLLLRTTSDNSLPTTSFLEHRRERSRSRSRGPSSLRGSFSHGDNVPLDLERALHQRNALETLVEAASPQYTPVNPGDSLGYNDEDNTPRLFKVEKRLPTLPNTPSSAYPPSTAGLVSPQMFSLQMGGFDSRFSASTIDTECPRDSVVTDPENCFAWSNHSVLMSPSSDSTVEDSIGSPFVEVEGFTPAVRSTTTRSPEPAGTFSPDDSHATALMFPTAEQCGMYANPRVLTPARKTRSQETTGISDFQQHYRLPDSIDLVKLNTKSNFSIINALLPATPSPKTPLKTHHHHHHNHHHLRAQSQQFHDRRSGCLPSDSMQQLMRELSYLGNVITAQQ